MKFIYSLAILIAFSNASAANSFWHKTASRNLQLPGVRKIMPQKTSIVKLDDASFKQFKQQIPKEESGRFTLMTLPVPDGTEKVFKVFERTCMEKELADKYPNIKTYEAISVEDPTVVAKLDYTEFGFHAMVFSREGTYFIDPYTNVNTGVYNCYYKKDYTRPSGIYSVCETPSPDETSLLNNSNTANRLAIVPDTKRRTFRLALACTIEYAAAVGGATPTKASVLAAMVTSVNRVNGVYEKELSIHMNLVAKEDTLIFITSDSYSNNNGGAMLGQNQTICDNRIGSANYDIGHVFSTGGGGIAGLGVVCDDSQKANGVTGSPDPTGDGFDIDYVVHEMGHQYGANHTFNAITGSCAGNRVASVAYEVGSATTIMGYAGICDNNDVQPHSDDYFHRASINEIYTYISSTSCASIATTTNTPPTVNTYTATYYIPYKTDFEITASATDPNSLPLTYCWEEYDLGPAGDWNASNNTTAPIFRSFNPTSSPTRVFPKWDSLIRNSIKYIGEILPEVARDTKFRCTVRNISNGWGIYNGPNTDLTLKSIVTTSLFRVTSHATNSTITGNASLAVTWDVAGTTASPISCANVDIYLSLDSARTFPYLLASGVPNNGTASVLIPNVSTTTSSARIKVKGSGNVFFDLNNGWIKINAAVIGTATALFTASDSTVCQGSSITFTNTSTGSPDSVRWTLTGTTPTTSNSNTTVTATYNTAGTYTVSLTAYKGGVASPLFVKTINVNANKTTNFSQTICTGQSVTVGTQTFSTVGLHSVVLQTSKGCDSTVNLTLAVNPTKTTNFSQTVCQGQSVTVGTQTFTTAGLHTVLLQTSLGCDSTVNLTLAVNPTKTTNFSQTVCQGQSVTVGTQTFTTAGLHTVHLQTSLGCDSAVNLTLSVNPTKITNFSQTVCQGQSVTVGTQTFTTAGLHTVHLQTSLGCDSAVNLTLAVNPTMTTNFSQTVCQGQSVTVGTQTFTTAGLHTVHLQTSLGCDSAVNLTLAVNPTQITNFSQTICDGENVMVGTQLFTTAGLHTVHLQTSLGCDSTVNLNLSVTALPSKPMLSTRNDSLVATGSTGSQYSWYLNGNLQGNTNIPEFKITAQGSWTVIVVANNCSSAVSDALLVTGLKPHSLDVVFSISPNPNSGQFEVKLSAVKPGKYEIAMYNVTGQEILKEQMNMMQGENTMRYNLNIEKGMYFISITGDDGIVTKNIIVQ